MSLRFFGVYTRLPLLLLGIAEFLALVAGFLFATREIAVERTWMWAVVFAAVCLLVMGGMGLYSHRLRARTSGVLLRVLVGIVTGAILTHQLLRALDLDLFTWRVMGVAALSVFVVVGVIRAIASHNSGESLFRRNVLIFGSGTRAQNVTQLRRRSDQRAFKVVGYLQPDNETVAVPEDRLLRPDGSLLQLAERLEVDEIVVAMDDRRRNFPVAELLECRLAGIDVSELVSFLERETGKVHLDVLHPSWLIFSDGFRSDFWREGSRRIFDIVASSVLLVVASPLMLLAALAIKLEDGIRAPVIYSQTRVGLLGKPFRIFKFRSMRIDAEKDGKAQWASKDDNRITRVGGLIRKMRVDELPQIVNVLLGDMSMVGPRPERPEFVNQLSAKIPYFRERHCVRPGITGWAQLCYAYGASEEDAAEKLQYDLYYVKNHNLFFDLTILLQTLEVILFGKGAR